MKVYVIPNKRKTWNCTHINEKQGYSGPVSDILGLCCQVNITTTNLYQLWH